MYYVYLTHLGKSVVYDELVEFPTYEKALEFAEGYVRGIELKVNSWLADRDPFYRIPYQAESFDGSGYAWYVCDLSNPNSMGKLIIILFDPPTISSGIVDLKKDK